MGKGVSILNLKEWLCFANFATFKKIKSLKMNYDQLIRHISELGGGDQELGSIRFFQQREILHQERTCEKCGTEMRLSTDRGIHVWRCKNKRCKSKKGLRTKTWFNSGNQGSKLSFVVLIKFIFYWSIESHSIIFCARELRMCKATTINYCSYMREVCSAALRTLRSIGGAMCTVEVDESLFSKRKNNAGRILPATWVVGAYCR